jgi:hypothetical protein
MKGATAVIQSIVPEAPQTWQGRCFITFDIDWARDAVPEDTMALFADADATATWFLTHDTRLLRSLYSILDWELGIHPDCNPLLDGVARTDSSSATSISDLWNQQRFKVRLPPERRLILEGSCNLRLYL